jgi:aryl-alcohol dehydrogenase-like predicted oxidoreductase
MEPRRHVLGPVTVSRIGFGAMQLPGPGVFGPPRDRTAAIAVLRRAVELGVDHIDTAQYYGPGVANELIRTALHPYPAGLALVSKVGARRDASGGVLRYDRPAELRQGIEDNLRSLLNLADRRSMPVLEECHARGIAFVPFFPLGSAFARGGNLVQASPAVAATAARLRCTPAQVALAWLLDLPPEVLLIPGTSSISHLEENMAVANIGLDSEARDLLG